MSVIHMSVIHICRPRFTVCSACSCEYLGRVLGSLPVHTAFVPGAIDGKRSPPASRLAAGQDGQDAPYRPSLEACLRAMNPNQDTQGEFDTLRSLHEELKRQVEDVLKETEGTRVLAASSHVMDPVHEGPMALLIPDTDAALQELHTATEAVLQRCQEMVNDARNIPHTEAERLISLNLEEFDRIQRSMHELQLKLDQLWQSHGDFCVSLRCELAMVVKVQQHIFRIRRSYPKHDFQQYIARAQKVSGRVNTLVQLPYAYTQTLREIIRRRKFSRTYGKVAQHSRQKLDKMRNAEIETRQKFHKNCGQYLPNWDVFRGLDDYPRTCVVKPQPFDTNLPNITVEDVEEAANTVQQSLGEDGMALLEPMWQTDDTDPTTVHDDSVLHMDESEESDRVRDLQYQLLSLHHEAFRLKTEKTELQLRLEALSRNASASELLARASTPSSAGTVVLPTASADAPLTAIPSARIAASVDNAKRKDATLASGAAGSDITTATAIPSTIVESAGERHQTSVDSGLRVMAGVQAGVQGRGQGQHASADGGRVNDRVNGTQRLENSSTSLSATSRRSSGASVVDDQQQLRAELDALRLELVQTNALLTETQADRCRLAENLEKAETTVATMSSEMDSSSERVLSPPPSPLQDLTQSIMQSSTSPPPAQDAGSAAATSATSDLTTEERKEPQLAFTGTFKVCSVQWLVCTCGNLAV